LTAKIQISKRLKDGTILVLGADNFDEFDVLLTDGLSSASASHVRGLFEDFAETGETAMVAEPRKVFIGEVSSQDKLGRF
jgi:hypothetical protein